MIFCTSNFLFGQNAVAFAASLIIVGFSASSLTVMGAEQTLADILDSDPRFETFRRFDQLNSGGQSLSDSSIDFTLFVPTNEAFAAMDPDFRSRLESNPRYGLHLSSLMGGHFFAGSVPARLISNDTMLRSVESTFLNFIVQDAAVVGSNQTEGVDIVVFQNQKAVATIVESDIVVSNGIIHAIDAVLNPLWMGLSVIDLINNDPNTTTVAGLLEFAGLSEILRNNDETYTVFVGSDETYRLHFAAHSIVPQLYLDETFTANAMKQNTLPSIWSELQLLDAGSVTSLLGEQVQFRTIILQDQQSTILIQEFMTPTSRDLAYNGIVYGVDESLVAPNFIDVLSIERYPFEEFIGLAERLALTLGLSFFPNRTIFVPTNHAFAKVPREFFTKLKKGDYRGHLWSVLWGHTIENAVIASNTLANGDTVTAATGAVQTFSIASQGDVIINNISKVVLPDIRTYNPGVVHGIDTVLMPIWLGKTVLGVIDTVSTSSTFSTFGQMAATSTEIVDLLATDRVFTLFVPNDAMFSRLFEDSPTLADTLTSQPDITKLIVEAHIIPFMVQYKFIQNGTKYPAVSGDRLTFRRTDEAPVTLNGIMISDVENFAENGIVYEIDGVILPGKLESLLATLMPTVSPVASTQVPTATPTNVASEACQHMYSMHRMVAGVISLTALMVALI